MPLEVTYFDIGELTTYHKNARRGDIRAIARSLAINGQYRAIVVNLGTHTGRPLEVLAGNHTLQAARELAGGLFAEEDGINPDPARWRKIAATTVDADEVAAARIVAADNRTADLGDYDEEALLDLLRVIEEDDPSLDGTGYDDTFHGEERVAIDLDALAEQYGEPDEKDLWPTIQIRKAPPTLAAAWRDHVAVNGGDDVQALAVSLGIDLGSLER